MRKVVIKVPICPKCRLFLDRQWHEVDKNYSYTCPHCGDVLHPAWHSFVEERPARAASQLTGA